MKRSRIYHSVLSVLILSMVITSAVSCNKLSKENYDSLVLVDNQNSSSSKESDSKNESGSETQNVQDSGKNTGADNSDTVKNDSDKNKNTDSDGTSHENKNTTGSADGTSTDDNNTSGLTDGTSTDDNNASGLTDGTSTDDNNTSGLTDGSGNVPDGITGNNTDTTDDSSLTGTDADASGNATNQNTDGNSNLKNGIQNDDNENTENDKNPEQNINSEDIDSKGNISNDKSGNNNTVESDDIAGTGSSDGTDIKSGTGSSEDTDIKSGTGSSEDTDIKSGTESSDGTDNKSDSKNSSDSKDNKEIEDNNNTKDINNTKDNKDTKDNQDTKDTKDSKNIKKDANEKIFDDTKTNRYKSQELKDYIQKPVTEMTDEEFAAIAPTVNMSFEELVGDNGIYNGYPKAFPKPDTYKLVVDLRYKIVMAFTRDEKGDYTVPHRFMICSPGADGSNTPTGTFSMKDYRVRFSIFRNTESYGQYWSLINGKIYFHSLLYTSLNASDYTESSYRNLGTNVSHGCVRLAVPDARWIWYNIAPETTCIIRYGSKDDEQMQEIKKRLVLAKLPSKRVKLEKGKIPNTDNWSIDEVPQEVPFKNGSQD